MEKTEIIEILSEWNPWKGELKAGILRDDYLQRLRQLHETGQIITMSGVRRAGKSTLLKQYINEISKKHGSDTVLYVNLEEAAFGTMTLEMLMKIFEAYREIINPIGKVFLFLDEIQKINGWEKFVRGLHEKGSADIFVSGSTSELLSSEYGTLLTGRHVNLKIFPFSFKEFLSVRGIKSQKEYLLRKTEVVNLLTEYLQWGGFPKAVLSEEKKSVLSAYYDDILAKDIIERYKIREGAKLRELARYYLSNISAPQSFNNLGEVLQLSVDTIDRFSHYFCEAYLLFFTSKFSYSLKEQAVNPRKVYTIDSGLREANAFKFSKDIGRTIENTVGVQLLREGKEIYYWKEKRTDYEVDFIIKEGNELSEAIQVSYGGDIERQERALKALEKEHEIKKVTVIGWDKPETTFSGVPLWKWLIR